MDELENDESQCLDENLPDGELEHATSLELLHEKIYIKSLRLAKMKNFAVRLKEKINYLSEDIRQHLEHDELNQHTYGIGDLSVTVVNPVNYKLNTDFYLNNKDCLRSRGIDFVRRKVSYEIDKSKYTNYLSVSNPEDKEFLGAFAEKKLSSAKVTVKKNQEFDYDFV